MIERGCRLGYDVLRLISVSDGFCRFTQPFPRSIRRVKAMDCINGSFCKLAVMLCISIALTDPLGCVPAICFVFIGAAEREAGGCTINGTKARAGSDGRLALIGCVVFSHFAGWMSCAKAVVEWGCKLSTGWGDSNGRKVKGKSHGANMSGFTVNANGES